MMKRSSRAPSVRALILADDCNPEWPSLPVVGYQAARALAEQADVTVATHVRNRPNLEQHGFGRAEVVYLDNEYIARPLYQVNTWLRGGDEVGWTTNIAMNYPSYLAFEWEVWRRFGRELRAGRFDVVHRLTPMSPALPSPLARECPVPFVLGPLNGGLAWPDSFGRERVREKEWLVHLRQAYRLLPFHRSSYERSAAILAAFRHTLQDLPKSALERAILFPEVGVDPALFGAPPARRPGPLTFLFAGRLVPYKLPGVAIDCFARSAELRRHRLLVAGDGPEREALQRQVAEHGLEHCVELLGRKTQAEVAELMLQTHVFVFPSIRELGAGVIAEAMAAGACCVAVDYGGPAELLQNERGITVPLGSREQLTRDIQRELEALARAPELAREYGERARKYALEHLSWEVKAKHTLDIYRWVVSAPGGKPHPDAKPHPYAEGGGHAEAARIGARSGLSAERRKRPHPLPADRPRARVRAVHLRSLARGWAALWLAAFTLFGTVFGATWFGAACQSTPSGSSSLPQLGSVGPFWLSDQNGRTFSEQNLDGKVWVAAFMFTRCPTICPELTRRMRHVQEQAHARGIPLHLLSFSVDPENDTPEVLRRYAAQHEADTSTWSFLTGDNSVIRAAAEHGFKIGVEGSARAGAEHYGITHGTHLVLLDQHRTIRGYYQSSDPAKLAQLLDDAASLR